MELGYKKSIFEREETSKKENFLSPFYSEISKLLFKLEKKIRKKELSEEELTFILKYLVKFFSLCEKNPHYYGLKREYVLGKLKNKKLYTFFQVLQKFFKEEENGI